MHGRARPRLAALRVATGTCCFTCCTTAERRENRRNKRVQHQPLGGRLILEAADYSTWGAQDAWQVRPWRAAMVASGRAAARTPQSLAPVWTLGRERAVSARRVRSSCRRPAKAGWAQNLRPPSAARQQQQQPLVSLVMSGSRRHQTYYAHEKSRSYVHRCTPHRLRCALDPSQSADTSAQWLQRRQARNGVSRQQRS